MCMLLLNMFATRTAVNLVQLSQLLSYTHFVFFVLLLFSLYAQTDPR